MRQGDDGASATPERAPRGMDAVVLVHDYGVLDALASYDPVVVGTFPLGLHRPGSDVDVLCVAADLDRFEAHARETFGGRAGFRSHRRRRDGQPDAAVVRFELDGVPVELFAQPVPTAEQRGFRHFVVEQRLLSIGGKDFAAEVRGARRSGESVEIAFAEVLQLTGDPYLAILDLEHDTDAQLLQRIQANEP